MTHSILDGASQYGVMSREHLLLAIANDPTLARLLSRKFRRKAVSLIRALKAGRDHALADEAHDLVIEHILNKPKIPSKFVGIGSFGPFDIEIIGVPTACFVVAPEFGREGPFPSIESAEDRVIENFSDTLECPTPQRIIHRETKKISLAPPPKSDRPKMEVNIAGRWFAKLGNDLYFAHRHGQFCQDQRLSSTKLSEYLLKSPIFSVKEVREALGKAGWADVLELVDESSASARSSQKSEPAHAFPDEVGTFILQWISTNRKGGMTDHDVLYWAARAWVNWQNEQVPGHDSASEDIDLRWLHHRAASLVQVCLEKGLI
jgi:hypothetical protein